MCRFYGLLCAITGWPSHYKYHSTRADCGGLTWAIFRKDTIRDSRPTAWVHKRCLKEYSSPTGDDAKEIAALGKNDDTEDFVQFEREEMDSAELWERVIADLIEIEKRTGGRDKSPTTAIIETCLKTRDALGRK